MQLTPVGPDAVLVACGDEQSPADLAAWAREHELAREVVPGADTVLLDGIADPRTLPEVLGTWKPGERPPLPDAVEVPLTYDGEDLDDVARMLDLTTGEVVRRHQETAWASRFCGFAPGFAYLAGWDLRVSRRATPRTKVPPGSVALADGWCGVYPVASPGGWQLIGHTDLALWDPARNPPALLAPGTPVRFVVSS